MIITCKHRDRASRILENKDVEESIKDTLKVIACLIPEKKEEVEKFYNILFKVSKKDDSFYKKIRKFFFR